MHEPLGPEHRCEFRAQYLDRDLAFVLEILSEVDGRHAAFAQAAFDLVAIGEGGREAFGDLGHGALRYGLARTGASRTDPIADCRLVISD